MICRKLAATIGMITGLIVSPSAFAEMTEVKIAKQYGISYLPLMLMEADKLLEKAAKDAGLGDVTVGWLTFAGGPNMNDAILSDSGSYVEAEHPFYGARQESSDAM